MTILVTGVGGQLGYDVIKELEKRNIEYIGADIQQFDITDYNQTQNFIVSAKPDAIIHCSAYTAVDKAEENIEVCHNVNVVGTENIAKVCHDIDAKMIYISTDYVFPGVGNKEYEVDDETGPLNEYGKSKLQGELAVKKYLTKYFIVRTSWVFGRNGNNFVKTMLKLAETHDEINVVCDQIGSPTYTPDLAALLCDMIMTEKYGTYHATNEGFCSWADFAEEIFRLTGKNVKVNRIKTSDYKTKATRPLNSRLSKKSLDNDEFVRMSEWRTALLNYFYEFKEGKNV